MITPNESKMISRSSFYFEEAILKEFKENCKREHVTMSYILQEAMKRYNIAHAEGSLQRRIEHFNGDKLSKKSCQKCGKENLHLLKVLFISGKTGEVCRECAEKWRVRGTSGIIKKVLGVA